MKSARKKASERKGTARKCSRPRKELARSRQRAAAPRTPTLPVLQVDLELSALKEGQAIRDQTRKSTLHVELPRFDGHLSA